MPTVKELQAALRKEGMATDGKKAVLEARAWRRRGGGVNSQQLLPVPMAP